MSRRFRVRWIVENALQGAMFGLDQLGLKDEEVTEALADWPDFKGEWETYIGEGDN